MDFYKVNICKIMIFRLYSVFNKHKIIIIYNQTREKSSPLYAKNCNFAIDYTINLCMQKNCE